MTRIVLCCAMLITASRGFAAETEDLMTAFATPNPVFSPVPIWWWSGDRIERDKISEQLRRMAEGGIYNAIILNLAPSGPLYGSAPDEPPFLSESWWDLFGFALEEAKKNGIRLWFYDQLGFSGAGLQARVVRDHPEFRGVTLERVVEDVQGARDVQLRVPPSGAPVAAFVAELLPAGERPETAQWIWAPDTPEGNVKRYFRREFILDAPPVAARVNISCDNGYVLYLNGRKLGEELIFGEQGWGRAERFDATPHLRAGTNVIAVEATNLAGIGGLIVEFLWQEPSGALVSDGAFRVTETPQPGWTEAGFDDHAWAAAEVIGPPAQSPWPLVQGLETATEADLGVKIRNVRNVSDGLREGVLHIQVPDGAHRVQVFYTLPGGFDYQNPAAGAALLDIVHGEMERRFGQELGKGIAGSFQDEFPALPRYSLRMPEEFLKRKGYDLIARLPALHDDVVDRFGETDGPDTIQIRCDANDVAAALNEEAFFIPLHEWHERYGMLCGYDQTVRNADPIRGEQYYVDYFKTQRHYSAPGNDMDGDCKPHQSIADLYGRPRVWIEAFHSSGWGQTLEEIAVLLHPWLANGATLFDPHAIYYSIHGSYFEWAPPDTGWRQPYFVHYDALADYVSRLCEALSQGRHVVHVGVLHPARTVHAYSGFGGPSGPAQEASRAYWAVQASLQQARVDYITVDEDSLARMTAHEGALIINDIRLESVVLPSACVLGTDSVRQLVAFAASGGQVIVVGNAPQFPADREGAKGDFTSYAERLLAKSVRIPEGSQTADVVLRKVSRNTEEPVISLHRRAGERDLFLVLSDDATPATGNARFDINKRALHETSAAKGVRIPVTFHVEGLPEFWDALTGQVRPILNYSRITGSTRVEVDLATTPAPLIAFRPAGAGDPLAVESDLDIISVKRDGEVVRVTGVARADSQETEHRVRVVYDDKTFEGNCPVVATERIAIEGPLSCRLEPTCDNWDGSFAWPPSKEAIPVEIRAFRFKPESIGEDSGPWTRADFQDQDWQEVIASFGPRALMSQAITAKVGRDFDAIAEIPADLGELRPAVYSLKLGINEDPVFSSALGGKGRIPEEFIDFGDVVEGHIYVARAVVLVPESVGPDGLKADLRMGGAAKKRAFLNGSEVQFTAPANARTRQGSVTLQPGPNRLDLLIARETNGRLRLFYQFLPRGAAIPAPEWIWSTERGDTERTRFVKRFEVDGKVKRASMVVALGDLHQIRVNGTLVADQGNFDPYFTSRAERYDISQVIREGENEIQILARDTGSPVGLLVDGLVELEGGGEVVFVSDATWTSAPAVEPGAREAAAQIRPGPAHGYMGDPACLLLRPRPHPLPLAGWLLDQPPPAAPFDQFVYATGTQPPPAGWYRFRVPPGAVKMRLETPGEARLFINGEETVLQRDDAGYTAILPMPDAPTRMAALRIASTAGFEEGAAIEAPVTFEMGEGRIPFGSWDELGLPHYSGGLVYAATLDLAVAPDRRVVLDLGRVRGSAEVRVNGRDCGVRIWHPYRFDITDAVRAGKNTIEMRVFNTLGPHFAVGHPSRHVFEGHTKSGIFGPVAVYATQVCTLELSERS